MSFLTIGDILAVTVDSMYIADGDVVLMVSDKDGVEYTMKIGQAPSRPQQAPEAPEAPGPGPGLALAPEARLAVPQRPSRADAGAQDQPQPAPVGSFMPRPQDDPESIALWLADNATDLKYFSAKLSLRKRQLITEHLVALLPDEDSVAEALAKFSAVEPPPEFTGESAIWGYEGSPAAAGLHEGNITKLLERQATEHAKVDSRLGNRRVKSPKGDALTAEKAIKSWGDSALGK